MTALGVLSVYLSCGFTTIYYHRYAKYTNLADLIATSRLIIFVP